MSGHYSLEGLGGAPLQRALSPLASPAPELRNLDRNRISSTAFTARASALSAMPLFLQEIVEAGAVMIDRFVFHLESLPLKRK